jgi:hypothetical protein
LNIFGFFVISASAARAEVRHMAGFVLVAFQGTTSAYAFSSNSPGYTINRWQRFFACHFRSMVVQPRRSFAQTR